MKLDKFSDYALRVLIALAVSDGQRLSSSDIARRYGLSEHHIAKVATQLARGGFVHSERGRGGGLTLARPACDISVGAVLRAVMGNDPVVECFGNASTCVILPACGLRAPLAEANEAFFKVLDSYTLSDITTKRADILALLAP